MTYIYDQEVDARGFLNALDQKNLRNKIFYRTVIFVPSALGVRE
jgi:hypothetical protein